MFTLGENDYIVTAFAEPEREDSPIWVIVRDGAGNLRQECIPSSKQNETMRMMYKISTDVQTKLIWAARAVADKNKKLMKKL